MSKKALLLAAIYSAIVIIVKLFIWQGGHTFDPAYRWAHSFTILGIIPFIIFGVKWVRDTDKGGFIGGKQAGRVGLQIAMFSILILFVYNYIEFKNSIELYKAYYHGPEFLTYLEKDPQAKKVGYDKAIEMMISELSPFKASTMKMFSLLVISFPCAFLCAVFMKKSQA
ncbi:MAG: DUF4199 domain-containing protein [Bacteroidota bacterium]|nr:DUF4199 domain-containing protein [Bacteroidota bacterium]